MDRAKVWGKGRRRSGASRKIVELVPSALLDEVVAATGRLSLGRDLVVKYAAQASANELGVAVVLDEPLAVSAPGGCRCGRRHAHPTGAQPVSPRSRTTGEPPAMRRRGRRRRERCTRSAAGDDVLGVWGLGVVLLGIGDVGELSVLVSAEYGAQGASRAECRCASCARCRQPRSTGSLRLVAAENASWR